MKQNLYLNKIFITGLSILFFIQLAKAQWAPLGAPESSPNSLGFSGGVKGLCTDPAGNVYVSTTTFPTCRVVKFDGTSWAELGGPNSSTFNNTTINDLVSDPQGNIYVAFLDNAPGSRGHVKRWNGSMWTKLGGDLGEQGTYINSMLFHNNQLYVAGNFLNATTFGSHYVAVWNGSTWSELGGAGKSTFNSSIYSIAVDADGFIYAAGMFRNELQKYYVAKFNGTSWDELGGKNSSDFNMPIRTLTTDKKGNVYAAGEFTNASGKSYVAKWNGSWSELGGTNSSSNPPIPGIENLITDNQDKVYVAGWKRNSKGNYMVQVWDGSTWSELGGTNSSYMNDFTKWMAFDSQYNLYVTGGFRDGFGKMHVAYYKNSTSLEEKVSELPTLLFPNPAKDFIQINQEFDGARQYYEIFNSIGQSLSAGIVSKDQNAIAINNLPSGIYMLRLSGKQVGVLRFVRE